jgi:hypothetical protein
MTKDDQTTRETPAKDEDDWQSIWKAVERSEKLWWLIGPLHAVVSNWKAIVAVAVIVAWLSRDDIQALLASLTGL